MSGVSNMLPFVVAGGILIAVSFLWGFIPLILIQLNTMQPPQC